VGSIEEHRELIPDSSAPDPTGFCFRSGGYRGWLWGLVPWEKNHRVAGRYGHAVAGTQPLIMGQLTGRFTNSAQ
jgi:hypothetical protein